MVFSLAMPAEQRAAAGGDGCCGDRAGGCFQLQGHCSKVCVLGETFIVWGRKRGGGGSWCDAKCRGYSVL